jgi:hypothetical protein
MISRARMNSTPNRAGLRGWLPTQMREARDVGPVESPTRCPYDNEGRSASAVASRPERGSSTPTPATAARLPLRCAMGSAQTIRSCQDGLPAGRPSSRPMASGRPPGAASESPVMSRELMIFPVGLMRLSGADLSRGRWRFRRRPSRPSVPALVWCLELTRRGCWWPVQRSRRRRAGTGCPL